MYRLILAVCLAAPAAFGLDNSVTVYNASGAAQTNLPQTHGRYFAEGEIQAACVQPFIGGEAAAAWQCDKKNAWPDGSLKFAVVSYRIPSLGSGASVTVDFRPSASASSAGSGLTKAAAAALTWSAEIEYWFNKGTADEFGGTVSAKTMLSGLAESSCGVRKWLDGPVVTEFIIEDACVGDTYDFGAQWDNANSKWVTAPSIGYKSLHPVFQVRVYSDYPSSGEYAVRVREIVENTWLTRRQNQTFSFEMRANGSVIESQDPYTMPHGTRFGFDGAANANAIPASFVDPNLPYLIYSKVIPAYETEPVTADGAVIGKGGADEEINQSGSITAYGFDATLGTYNSEPERPQYCRATVNKCRNASACCAQWTKPLTSPGAGGEVAPIPRFYLKWLYIARNTDIPIATRLAYFNKPLIGNAQAATNAPLHFRDDGTGTAFCANLCTTGALKSLDVHGRIFSIDAYPSKSLWNNQPVPYTTVSGCASGQPCYPTTNGWSVLSANDTTHAYAPAFVPYVLTGDWYWMSEQMFWSGWSAGSNNPGDSGNIGRGGRIGYLNNSGGVFMRGQSWLLRNVAQGAAILPDGLPEKEYLHTILDNTVAVEEGYNSLTTADGAAFYDPAPECTAPCKTVPWRFGQDIIRVKNWNGSVDRVNLQNPLHFLPKSNASGTNVNGTQGSDSTKTYGVSTQWMEAYEAISLGMARDLGFSEVQSMQKMVSAPAIQVVQNPGMNPFSIQAYQWPMGKLSTSRVAISAASKTDTNQITFTTAAPHGFTTGWEVAICCALSSSNWKYANFYPLTVTVIDDTHFSITSSIYTSVSGDYPGGMYAARGASAVGDPIGDGGYFSDWSTWWDAFHPDEKADAGFRTSNIDNRDGGYAVIAAAHLATAAQFGITSGAYSARRAYAWMRANVGFSSSSFANADTCGYTIPYCQNPLWMITPRPEITNLVVTPASNAVIFRFTAPTGDGAKVRLATTPADSSLDGGDTAATCSGRSCLAVIAASASTAYYYRITAGAMGGTARTSGTVTTPAAGSATSILLKLKPPAMLAVSSALVEYGATDSYGSALAAMSCGGGCTAYVPATRNTSIYLRWTYRDAQGAVVATGSAVRRAE